MATYIRKRIRMVLKGRVIKGKFVVRIREGVNLRVASDMRDFYRMGLPWRDEEYPSLGVYWKIRLLRSKFEHTTQSVGGDS